MSKRRKSKVGPTELAGTVGVAAGVIGIFSFLYRENWYYSIWENVYLALTLSMYLVTGWGSINRSAIQPLLSGQIINIIPIMLGLSLFFSLLSKEYRSPYRLGTGFLIGIGAGLGIRGAVSAYIVDQMKGSIISIFNPSDLLTTLNNILIIVGSVTVLLYFSFTREHKGIFGVSAKVGRYFIMAALGALYGSTIQMRYSTVVYALKSILLTPGVYLIPIAFAIIAIDVFRRRKVKTV